MTVPGADETGRYRTPSGLAVATLQPAIGGEISGIDLRDPIAGDAAEDIRQALWTHGVVFFRDQPVTYQQHVALGRIFGEVLRNGQDPDRPEILTVESGPGSRDESANIWHTDGTFQPEPPSVSILRAIHASPLGGDTCFASAVAAYEGLTDEMKARIAGLRATSSFKHIIRQRPRFISPERMAALEEKWPVVDHPVVRIHPETGKPTLYVNDGQTIEILGVEKSEERELLRFLTDQFRRPEYQVRWRWTDNAIAVWDNRAVQHYGVPDQQGHRLMERVTVAGTAPVGITG